MRQNRRGTSPSWSLSSCSLREELCGEAKSSPCDEVRLDVAGAEPCAGVPAMYWFGNGVVSDVGEAERVAVE